MRLIRKHSFLNCPPPDIYNKGRHHFQYGDNCPIHEPGSLASFCHLSNVAMLCKYFKDIDVMACAGLTTPEQCIEVMMIGAGPCSFVGYFP